MAVVAAGALPGDTASGRAVPDPARGAPSSRAAPRVPAAALLRVGAPLPSAALVPAVAPGYPVVDVAYLHVDAATIHMITDPGRFDVIVTDNLFGDIITDLAAAVCGGIGLAASGNIDATFTYPSMFEPVHGSAPDIAGQGIADPTAAIMSVALLLAHLGELRAAARVDSAVEDHLANRGEALLSTSAVGERILGKLC